MTVPRNRHRDLVALDDFAVRNFRAEWRYDSDPVADAEASQHDLAAGMWVFNTPSRTVADFHLRRRERCQFAGRLIENRPAHAIEQNHVFSSPSRMPTAFWSHKYVVCLNNKHGYVVWSGNKASEKSGFFCGGGSASDGVSERVKRLLAEARAWCDEERGRQTKLAAYLGVSRHSLNAWFAEARRERPRKQPTAEQALAISEYLKAARDTSNRQSQSHP